MFRNHPYLDHRYCIRFALFLMTLVSRVHAQGGTRGQDLGHLIFFYLFIFLLSKNDILFSSRTEDLTLNVCDQVLD